MVCVVSFLVIELICKCELDVDDTCWGLYGDVSVGVRTSCGVVVFPVDLKCSEVFVRHVN